MDDKKRELQLELLATLGQTLAASLDRDDTIESSVRLVVPTVADGCVVRLLEHGELRVATARHRRPEHKGALLAMAVEMQRAGRVPEEIRDAIRTGKPVAIQRTNGRQADPSSAQHVADFLNPLGIESYAIVPLVSRGAVIGTMSFISDESAHHFDEGDLHFLTAIATRVGLTVEKSRMYLEARQAVQAREDVLAIVAHDLRNPLATIGMAAEMVVRLAAAEQPKVTEYAKMIQCLVDRMDRLVKDLLDFGKMQAGTFSLEPAEVNLVESLSLTVESARLQAAAKNQEVELVAPPGGALLRCDGARVGQVISNLVGNAVKFSPRNSLIRVELRDGSEGVEVSVADQGPGISPELLPKIFERYWQGEDARQMGSGLGLAIAKGIVEAHGGRIWADCELGLGCRFAFSLPKAAPQISMADQAA